MHAEIAFQIIVIKGIIRQPDYLTDTDLLQFIAQDTLTISEKIIDGRRGS